MPTGRPSGPTTIDLLLAVLAGSARRDAHSWRSFCRRLPAPVPQRPVTGRAPSSSSLPTTPPSSSNACACAASAIGNRGVHDRAHPPVGDHRPHVLADRRRRSRAFRRPSTGRPRRPIAVTLPRLRQQLADVQLGLHPALHADDQQPAVEGERVEVGGQALGAHVVEDDVGAVAVGGLLQLGGDVVVVVDRRCRRRARGRAAAGPACPAVAATRAPSAFATWIACVPMPLLPPWTGTSRRGRGARPSRRSTRPCTPPRAARRPSTRSTPSGTGQQLRRRHRDLLARSRRRPAARTPRRRPPGGDTLAERRDPARALQADDLRRARRRRVVALRAASGRRG